MLDEWGGAVGYTGINLARGSRAPGQVTLAMRRGRFCARRPGWSRRSAAPAQPAAAARRTIKLVGTSVNTIDTLIDAQGGFGPGFSGDWGRFVIGSNTGSIDYFGPGGWQIFAWDQYFGGPMAANPFVDLGGGAVLTPLLPNLVGGAEAYGMLGFGAQTLLSSQVIGEAPAGAGMAVIRVDAGIGGLIPDFAGYDLLLVANLTSQGFDLPALRVGSLGDEALAGGFAQDEARRRRRRCPGIARRLRRVRAPHTGERGHQPERVPGTRHRVGRDAERRRGALRAARPDGAPRPAQRAER
jgi:hypothetical protein